MGEKITIDKVTGMYRSVNKCIKKPSTPGNARNRAAKRTTLVSQILS